MRRRTATPSADDTADPQASLATSVRPTAPRAIDPALHCAAPPAVALSSMNCLLSEYITGEAAKKFEGIKIPVLTVNADMWPVDYEANRRHIKFFETITLEGADHFLMLNRPREFNRALEQAIGIVLKNSKLAAAP